MRKLWEKRGFFAIGVVVALFALVSYLSLSSIHQLRGNARVINYTGIVRGATQRLVKQELHGQPNDALILRLDQIIIELNTGEGNNHLVALPDPDFQSMLAEVRTSWTDLKAEIALVRAGAESQSLFDKSDRYFILVDRLVSAAETYSEAQVSLSTRFLIGVDMVFVLLLLVGVGVYLRSEALRRRADALGKIAYVDPLTQLPNRASCEREISAYTISPPEGEVAVYMFDMNHLKRVNDLLGHQGGDRIIADFAHILKTEGAKLGFVGRYGGDEFVALFPNCDQARAERYLVQVREKADAYNRLHTDGVGQISFAAGFVLGSPSRYPIMDMINEADRRMYIHKREMKSAHDQK